MPLGIRSSGGVAAHRRRDHCRVSIPTSQVRIGHPAGAVRTPPVAALVRAGVENGVTLEYCAVHTISGPIIDRSICDWSSAMEQQRFEDLTRGLAQARSRREVVKAVFGTLLAGGVIGAQRGGVLAQTPCTDDTACADTDICCGGFCRELECCIEDADPNARCPEGTSCFEGVCDPIDEPVACESDDTCSEGEICCAGACRAIECCIDDADPNARCPEGTSCFEGVCDPIDEPGACSSDDECGEGEICCAGGCHAIECCIDDDDPNARCPEGTSCFEGVCDPIETGEGDGTDGGSNPPVVSLPATGSGSAARDGSSMLGAILAGGAALAAGLGLRARRAQPAEAEPEHQSEPDNR